MPVRTEAKQVPCRERRPAFSEMDLLFWQRVREEKSNLVTVAKDEKSWLGASSVNVENYG